MDFIIPQCGAVYIYSLYKFNEMRQRSLSIKPPI